MGYTPTEPGKGRLHPSVQTANFRTTPMDKNFLIGLAVVAFIRGFIELAVRAVRERRAGQLTPSQAFLASTFDARFTLAVVLALTCIVGSTGLLDWLGVPSGALWRHVVFGVDALMAVGIWFALRSIALHYMPRGGRNLTPR